MAGTQEINIFRNQANLGSEASHCTAASGPISGLSVLGCKMGTPADELTLLLKTKAPPSVLGVWLVTFAFHLVSLIGEPGTCRRRLVGALRCGVLAVRGLACRQAHQAGCWDALA